jgi:WD40 repeat protein
MKKGEIRSWTELPAGVRLVRTLRGHKDWIGRIAWSPDGRLLATPSQDKTIRLWNAETGDCVRVLSGEFPIESAAFDPQSRMLASGDGGRSNGTLRLWDVASGELLRTMGRGLQQVSGVAFDSFGRTLANGSLDCTVMLWDLPTARIIHTLHGHSGFVDNIVFHPLRDVLASSSYDRSIKLWNTSSGALLRSLEGHSGATSGLAFVSSGEVLASGSWDKTVKLWDVSSGQLIRTLEGHTDEITVISITPDERLLATRGDDFVGLWRADTWECIAKIPGLTTDYWPPSLAFHPSRPILAVVGSDPGTAEDERDRLVHIWELDFDVLLGKSVQQSVHYVNAKVVLIGDTGVGKSGLSLVLNHMPFEATESTPGRRVWTFDSRHVKLNGITQTRETLLWDLAGQPGYRIIHQLHLNEVAVALIVFDARSETDPLAGVRHWERALRVARQRQGSSGVPMKKFLVSARNDRGGVSLSEERLNAILKEFEFDAYFKTSAKEGWDIDKLREAIEEAIAWEKLPEVSSSQLFAEIKSFLLQAKETGRLLGPVGELYGDFVHQRSETAAKIDDLKNQFDTCIGRLENRDLIRRLTFGGYVLLQPELLDAYASAMVNTAKDEPDGLGSIAEEIALSGKFFVPAEQKIQDVAQEQLLLHATVEELVRHDLALRESADDGRYSSSLPSSIETTRMLPSRRARPLP